VKLFIDTSSLFKLYHLENGTIELRKFLAENSVSAVYISGITEIELHSTVFKKLRTNEIKQEQSDIILGNINKDIQKYVLVTLNHSIINTAKKLFFRYGVQGLRSLDALQMASAIAVKESIDFAITSDSLLNTFFQEENLPTFKI
jgi:PIN domain nuclease of toxin-antitoxin system